MREIFRDIMLAVGVILAGLSAYFQWRGPMPTDPPTVQKVISHPIAGLALVGVLFAIAGILNSAPLILRFLPRKDAAAKTTKSDEATAKPDALCEALRQIATTDAEKISERVQEIKQRMEFHFAPGAEPSIDVITELWNGSVFDLVNFGEISGHATYAGRQLATDPRIIVSVEPILLNLKHGARVTLVVRQYVSTEMADMMEANRNRSVAIDFQSVFVPFKALRLPDIGPPIFRWQGPRFSIEDAERI